MPLTTVLPATRDYPLCGDDPAHHFLFYHEIEKKAGIIDMVVEWCKTEMAMEWRWQLLELSSNSSPGKYRFFFNDEQDYCSFLLKWG